MLACPPGDCRESEKQEASSGGWEREPLFCPAACGGSDAQGIRLCVFMAFINSAINMLKVLVIAIGCGLAVWGVINLLEGYGNDNPGANAHVR